MPEVQRASRRVAELATGFFTWKAADYAFDYVLYPFVIWKFGLLYGGLAMAALSLLFCLFLLNLYDRLGRDWLGLEFVKSLQEYRGDSKWRRFLALCLKKGGGIAFIVLSVKYDPFITTAYLRQGSFNGMTSRDWVIFLGSWIIGNTTWALACFGGLSVVSSFLGRS